MKAPTSLPRLVAVGLFGLGVAAFVGCEIPPGSGPVPPVIIIGGTHGDTTRSDTTRVPPIIIPSPTDTTAPAPPDTIRLPPLPPFPDTTRTDTTRLRQQLGSVKRGRNLN